MAKIEWEEPFWQNSPKIGGCGIQAISKTGGHEILALRRRQHGNAGKAIFAISSGTCQTWDEYRWDMTSSAERDDCGIWRCTAEPLLKRHHCLEIMRA